MYVKLTPEQRDQLRDERVLGLEADHYRLLLLIAELAGDTPEEQRAAMSNELADLERRIAVHRVDEPAAPRAEEPADGHPVAAPAPNGRVSA